MGSGFVNNRYNLLILNLEDGDAPLACYGSTWKGKLQTAHVAGAERGFAEEDLLG